MLPELAELLQAVPEDRRTGWIVDPKPVEVQPTNQQQGWFMPQQADLENWLGRFSNRAIARACCVSETTVRKWMKVFGLKRQRRVQSKAACPEAEVALFRQRARKAGGVPRPTKTGRMSVERVGRIIAKIGRTAGIVVKQPGQGQEPKYASAHDLRRSVACRLSNQGVSAETLMVIMRHQDFETTLQFYDAQRKAQPAAKEVYEKLARCNSEQLVGGLMGGTGQVQLSEAELLKLKMLLGKL